MKFNIWRHLRLAGALILCVGSFMENWSVVLLGFVLNYVAMSGAIDRLERLVFELSKPNEEDK